MTTKSDLYKHRDRSYRQGKIAITFETSQLFALVVSEGSGRGIIRFYPFGHPHVWSEMFAFWVKFFELATVEERLFCLGRVEWEDLGSLRQICSW